MGRISNDVTDVRASDVGGFGAVVQTRCRSFRSAAARYTCKFWLYVCVCECVWPWMMCGNKGGDTPLYLDSHEEGTDDDDNGDVKSIPYLQ
jgi:hypothetical protein